MTATELVEITVRDFPIGVWERSAEHFAGLQREFTLLSLPAADPSAVPQRLLDLVAALTDRFAALTAANNELRDAAARRGDRSVPELVYRVPAAVADAAEDLSLMLDEADAFCRDGDVLLTLASPAEVVAFRRWFLGEFVAQVHGLPPLPWSEADHDRLVADGRLRGRPEEI